MSKILHIAYINARINQDFHPVAEMFQEYYPTVNYHVDNFYNFVDFSKSERRYDVVVHNCGTNGIALRAAITYGLLDPCKYPCILHTVELSALDLVKEFNLLTYVPSYDIDELFVAFERTNLMNKSLITPCLVDVPMANTVQVQ